MTSCQRPGCSGTYAPDGYCDECGHKAPANAPAATPAAPGGAAGPAGTRCTRAGCTGSYGADGYCDECGHKAPASAAGTHGPASTRTRSALSTRTGAGLTGRTGSGLTGRSSSRSGASRRGRLGAGLVEVPPVPLLDPATAVMTDPQVPEHKRFCPHCDKPVGRGKDGKPGRTEGFCPYCGNKYTFVPKLSAGDIVDRRYEILGALAHGGLGWIYLARDKNVGDVGSERWVVLKGLINTGDPDAVAAAMAERRFLVEVDHPNIVKIYDFTQHPDPDTGENHSYIVMEYVGGQSLKDLALARRNEAGEREPLPLPTVLAYGLEILPALGYLHDRGLVFCDFKPDNVIQSEEQLKVIDLGAVRAVDDEDGAIYGTPGYQSPDVATDGPTVGSDLYTVGRALAVLSFDFAGFSSTYRESLPGPDEIELLAREESFLRLLRRACQLDVDRRFGSAADMAEQVTGVLREVLSAADGTPRPAVSTLFTAERRVFGTSAGEVGSAEGALTGEALVAALPLPTVDPTDQGAGLLATLGGDPHQTVQALRTAQVQSLEVRLRTARAHIEAGDLDQADTVLAALATDFPPDWRFDWFRGMRALRAGDTANAVLAFDRVYDALPGEPAARLALAAACELAGHLDVAAERYGRVWRTDHGFVSAAFGLARILVRRGRAADAVRVLDEVPDSSARYQAAQVAAVRARLDEQAAVNGVSENDLLDASGRVERLGLDAHRAATLAVEVYRAALAFLGVLGPRVPGRPARWPSATSGRVLGDAFNERSLRFGLERAYRTLATLERERSARYELVDRANAVRPRTLV